MRRDVPCLAVVVAAAALTACGTEGAGARTVELLPERGFVPGSLTVEAGDTVLFDNRTTRARAVRGGSSDEHQFASGRILAYQSWAVRLEQPGTYVFVEADLDDPRFTAVVEVRP